MVITALPNYLILKHIGSHSDFSTGLIFQWGIVSLPTNTSVGTITTKFVLPISMKTWVVTEGNNGVSYEWLLTGTTANDEPQTFRNVSLYVHATTPSPAKINLLLLGSV